MLRHVVESFALLLRPLACRSSSSHIAVSSGVSAALTRRRTPGRNSVTVRLSAQCVACCQNRAPMEEMFCAMCGKPLSEGADPVVVEQLENPASGQVVALKAALPLCSTECLDTFVGSFQPVGAKWEDAD
jgi:hypothetical protein